MTAEVRTNETEPVRLTGSLDSPRLTGKLTIEQGSMVFPTARFTIDRGSEIELRYPFYAVATSDPSLGIVLDVTARTRLSATSDISGQRRRYTIIVEARGPLNDNAPLQITDTTDPTVNPFNYRGLRLTPLDPPDLASDPLGLSARSPEYSGDKSRSRACSEAGSMWADSYRDSCQTCSCLSCSTNRNRPPARVGRL